MPKGNHYKFAERVTRAGVTVGIYDGRPYSPDQMVRVRCEIDEVSYGYEVAVGPGSKLTIGQSLDLALAKLMKGIPDATNPRRPDA